MSAPAVTTWQVYRRADGGFAYKPDSAPLLPEEMRVGHGFDCMEALELVEEFNVVAAKAERRRG